ncbi:MAG: chromosome segregation protein SMC, partial [bacterium]
MRLKKMELYGFKSFAQKTVIEFGQGITAVVGPNGSGKSNVADAVRWALGEQSAKQLRGSKMEDVIFNGSRNKKGLGLAEVSLFFDNTDGLLAVDYNEVVITRRMYRSGESEYKLNNNLCRLKDIHELFMGTGVGKETYATIEQGKIDNLTSTRAEERRQVFEEAAGILKHKYKKKEALSKLSDVEQKILRLEDILKEIKQQLLPLQQQKEKAECFREYSSVLEEAERKTALNKWRILQEEKQRLNALKLENQTKQELLAGEFAELAASLTVEEQKIKQNEGLLTANLLKQQEIEGKAAFCRERIESTAGQLRELQEQEKNSQQRKEQLLTALAREEKEKLAYHKELAELERKLSGCGAELTLLGGKVAEQEGAVQKKVQDIEDLKGDLIELLNEKAKRQYELQRLAGQEEEHIKRLEQIEEKEQRLKADCGKAAEKIIELKERQEKLMAAQAAGLQKEHSLKAEITLLQEKLLERQKTWQEQESRLNQAKSRQKVLAELEQSLEGYYKGTKSILKSNLKERFLGTVAQLITVEKRYETAIEVALGGSLQNIITPTEKDAQSLIAYLKKTNGGRATFLPLNRVHGEKKQVGQMKGLIGLAADLLRFAPQYEGVINQLLGRILISDNLANASEIALNTGQRYKIITLDGDVISPGGAMTGGSFTAKQNGLLSRKRELEDLNFTITDLEEQQGKERRAISGLQKQQE